MCRVFHMRGRVLCAFVVISVVAGIGNCARADLTFFSDSSSFTSTNPGLALEDFESANVSPGAFVIVPGPVDSSTSNSAFGVGSLISGFSITGPTMSDNLVVTGTGNTTGGSKEVGVPTPEALNVSFSGAPSKVGLNLIATRGPGAPVSTNLTVNVFGSSGLLGTQSVSAGGVNTFLGIRSFDSPITRIQVTPENAEVLLDNLNFGTGAATFNSRSEFTAAHPSLSSEGFEAAKVATGSYSIFQGPVNSFTANPAFDVGGVLPGFSIASGTSDGNLVATGTDTTTGGTKELGSANAKLELTFAGQSAVGMDVIAAIGPGAPVARDFVVSVFGANGQILTEDLAVSGLATFFGIESPDVPITRIEINNSAQNSAVLVDNLTFEVPEPSGCLLIAGAVAGAGLLRRRRGRAA